LREAPGLAAALLTVRHAVCAAGLVLVRVPGSMPPADHRRRLRIAATAASAYVLAARMAAAASTCRADHGVDAAGHAERAAGAGGACRLARLTQHRWASAQSMCSCTSGSAADDVLQGRDDRHIVRRTQRVAERDRQVPLPAQVADAADRTALGAPQELGLAPGPQLQQRRIRHASRGSKSASGPAAHTCSTDTRAGNRRSRRCGCRSPRAARRESAVVLDRQVRDAAPRIEAVRAVIARVGQTSMQALQLPQWAADVTSAQRQIDEQLAEEEHRPASRASASVCLPRQPRPLRAASSTSSTGAESVKTGDRTGRSRRPAGRPASAARAQHL